MIEPLARAGEMLPPTPLVVTELTAFAAVWRYDDPPEEVLLEPAKAIETVRILREFVVARVADLAKESRIK